MANPKSEAPPEIQRSHTKEAIRERIHRGVRHSYLKDFIYGAIDGTVTTFAVVAGAEGAQFSAAVVVVLGIANLIADGFSMAVSNYLGTRAEEEMKEKAEKEEKYHLEVIPEGEREEVRQIFKAKGLNGEALDKVVEAITSDKDLWLQTMLQEEIGISLSPVSALKAALVTFTAFVLIGFFPLSAYILQMYLSIELAHVFYWSTALTALTFFAIGSVKSYFVEMPWYRSGLQTLFIGGMAALLAYLLGTFLKGTLPVAI